MDNITGTKINMFAHDMELEMDANSHKGNILEWDDPRDMVVELEEHKAKLILEMKIGKDPNKVREYIADCANILFAIGNSWKLYQ